MLNRLKSTLQNNSWFKPAQPPVKPAQHAKPAQPVKPAQPSKSATFKEQSKINAMGLSLAISPGEFIIPPVHFQNFDDDDLSPRSPKSPKSP